MAIIRQCAVQNLPLPPKIANAPELLPGLEFYWLAFQDLTTERKIGMGEGPIGWLAITEWADRHDVNDPEQREDLHYYLAQMDHVYLKHQAKRQSKLQPGKKGFSHVK